MSACGTRKVKVKTEKFAVTVFRLDVFTSDGNRSFSQCFRVVFWNTWTDINNNEYWKILENNSR